MKSSLSFDELCKYTHRLLESFFPDGRPIHNLEVIVRAALERLSPCISENRIFRRNLSDEIYFDHLHSDQFLIYLYQCSRCAHELINDKCVATKFYYLNKIRHSFDCYFETILPDVFYVAHGVGTVLGKAKYGNYLYVCKGVTVGASRGGTYPKIGNYVSLGSECTVIGSCKLDDMSTVGAGTTLFNCDVKSNHALVRNKDGAIESLLQEQPLAKYIFY